MKLAVLFSGGKDSTMALDWAIENFSVSCLISLKSENPSSYMFHVPNIDLVKKQAKALKIPIIFHTTKGKKEEELKDLKSAIKKAVKKYGIDGIVAGAIESKYQRDRIEKICEDLKIKAFTPYWHFDSDEYMNLLLKKRYKFLISAVAADGLGKEFLGKQITKGLLEDLKKVRKKHKIHLAGEGGEYETFVFDGPIFKKTLKVKSAETKWNGHSGEYLIKQLV